MDVCFHCGDDCSATNIEHLDKHFCCHGCKTVFDILNENDLSYYYELEHTPGTTPSRFDGKFDFFENETIAQKLLEFDEGTRKSLQNKPPHKDGSGRFSKEERAHHFFI